MSVEGEGNRGRFRESGSNSAKRVMVKGDTIMMAVKEKCEEG